MSNVHKYPNGRKISNVFTFSAIVVGIIVALGAIFPTQFGGITADISAWISKYFGWYYMIITILMVFFCVFINW